jgi:hypothetical protein
MEENPKDLNRIANIYLHHICLMEENPKDINRIANIY